MRLRILFVSLLVFITSNAFSNIDFEFNLGLGFDFPVSIISNLYDTALYIGEKLYDDLSDSDKEVISHRVADIANISNSGLTYGVHAQTGGRLADFISFGLELGVDFNLFRIIKSRGRLSQVISLIAAIKSRLYARLDFFIGAVLVFTGPRTNMIFADKGSICTEFGVFGWDLGARATFSFLMLEGYYSWNIKNNRFSDLKLGVGFEFGII
ncbi:hypothetical protein bmLB2001_000533 [Borrelia miyamotoi]|nr:hypothetical protein RJ61_02665 [Borrelia miyamotoi]AOW95761.1 hypothetical protein AXH25_02685 [Borrelia miyamotoi]QTL83943.1 hypothetical protein bmLB2001_000533 [Borrelia miyamotoi]